MSPSRATDRRAWWKSCHICANRSTGHADAGGQHVEGDKFADGEAALDDELCAKVQYSGNHRFIDKLNRLACRIAQADDAEARGHVTGELFLPAALHLRLDRHGLQRLDAGHAFDQEGLILGAAPELLVEPLAEQRRRPSRNRNIKWKGAEYDERQERRIIEHHCKEYEGEE